MTCGARCPARVGGETIDCVLSKGHDPMQAHFGVAHGHNVTWFNSENAQTPKFDERSFHAVRPFVGVAAALKLQGIDLTREEFNREGTLTHAMGRP